MIIGVDFVDLDFFMSLRLHNVIENSLRLHNIIESKKLKILFFFYCVCKNAKQQISNSRTCSRNEGARIGLSSVNVN